MINIIVYSDAELERRRLEQSRKGVHLVRERLRQVELDIDDASRVLRRARTKVLMARDQLEELKDRHWAILSFYNPDQAEAKVAEALQEFQLLEPTSGLDDFGVPQQSVSIVEPPSVEAPKESVIADFKTPSDRAREY